MGLETYKNEQKERQYEKYSPTAFRKTEPQTAKARGTRQHGQKNKKTEESEKDESSPKT